MTPVSTVSTERLTRQATNGGQRSGRTAKTMIAMTRQRTNRIMLAATILYGLAVAIVAVTAGDATGTVAIVGALIVGAGWTLTSIFVRNTG